VAPVPAGQPRVRAPGARAAALAALAGLAAVNVATYAGVRVASAVDDVARAALAALVLFGLAGYGIVRRWLPEALREHELLWVLPVGACAAALELAVLGYAGVPFEVALGVVLALGAVLAVRAGRPRLPARAGELGWPAWIAVLVACIALIPMFRTGIATVIGPGSDAHLAAGTAEFLRDHHPLSVAPEEPVDRVPLVWRSKPPIYYGLAGVATLSGLETWEAMATTAAVLLALTVVGFFLLARVTLGAGLAGAAAAMAVVGLDRVVLQTVMHPYFNQTWGLVTLPFALVLAAAVARTPTRGGLALLAGFLLVGAFAYPLAVPIPLVALAALLWPRRAQLRALLPRGRRAWLLGGVLALVLVVPVLGVLEKAVSAGRVVLDPTASLETWGGDLFRFIPEHQFLGLPSTSALVVFGPLLLAAVVVELRRQPRQLALALGAVVLFGALAALWFRPREAGWYFHFKALAFTGPLFVMLAAVGLSRLRRRRLAAAALTLFVLAGLQGAKDETVATYDQLEPYMLEVREVDALLPPGASVRLDMPPSTQLWIGYHLAGQPLCSARPLTGTQYPRVPYSRRAQYVLADASKPLTPDAVGPPLWRNQGFVLHRLRPGLTQPPGAERCSQEMVQTVTRVTL